ncbi:di-trans,poly-cis-decaprenylcistransferase, partial [Candidatus Woesearchaeota archaeon]
MVPKHIGIILDGNRRFSKKLMMKPWKGHEWGARKVEKLFEWAKDLGIKELTLYAFSVENFNRPKEEFEYLMELFRTEFKKLINDERLKTENVRINFIGRTWMFPEDIQESMRKLMDMTKENTQYIVNFAMAYGGKSEIIDAVRKIAAQIEKGDLDIDRINEETFKDYLY